MNEREREQTLVKIKKLAESQALNPDEAMELIQTTWHWEEHHYQQMLYEVYDRHEVPVRDLDGWAAAVAAVRKAVDGK